MYYFWCLKNCKNIFIFRILFVHILMHNKIKYQLKWADFSPRHSLCLQKLSNKRMFPKFLNNVLQQLYKLPFRWNKSHLMNSIPIIFFEVIGLEQNPTLHSGWNPSIQWVIKSLCNLQSADLPTWRMSWGLSLFCIMWVL